MDTLHEFLLLTKGQEYLVAVVILLLFPLFWRWLNGREGSRSTGE